MMAIQRAIEKDGKEETSDMIQRMFERRLRSWVGNRGHLWQRTQDEKAAEHKKQYDISGKNKWFNDIYLINVFVHQMPGTVSDARLLLLHNYVCISSEIYHLSLLSDYHNL